MRRVPIARLGRSGFGGLRSSHDPSGGTEWMPPNKRLKLPGPAFEDSVRLCPNQLVQQGGVLAPASARPAA